MGYIAMIMQLIMLLVAVGHLNRLVGELLDG